MYKKSLLCVFLILISLAMRPAVSLAVFPSSDSGAYDSGDFDSYYSSGSEANGVDIPTSSETGLSDRGIADILSGILRWMLGVVGIVAIIGFIVSGIQYITSVGEEKSMQVGKRNMTYSIIGVLIVLGSFVIIQAIDTMLRGAGVF